MTNVKIHCLMRSGSTFLQRFFSKVCKIKNVPYFTVKTAKRYQNKGCLCPIRIFPLGGINKHFNETEISEDINYIVQIRDARDCLTSLYYYMYNCVDKGSDYKIKSKKFVRSHNINEYAKSQIGSGILLEKHKPLLELQQYDNITFVTYEDMVLNFPKWAKVITKNFNLNRTEYKQIVTKFKKEFEGVKETNPKKIIGGLRKSHKRRIYPGDYKNKFDKQTIKYLNNQFSPYLDLLQKISINYKY